MKILPELSHSFHVAFLETVVPPWYPSIRLMRVSHHVAAIPFANRLLNDSRKFAFFEQTLKGYANVVLAFVQLQSINQKINNIIETESVF